MIKMKNLLAEQMLRFGTKNLTESQKRQFRRLLSEVVDPELKKVVEPYFLTLFNSTKSAGAIATKTAIYYTYDNPPERNGGTVTAAKATAQNFYERVGTEIKTIPMITFAFSDPGTFRIVTSEKDKLQMGDLKFGGLTDDILDISGGVGSTGGWVAAKGAQGVAAAISKWCDVPDIPNDVWIKHLELNRATLANQLTAMKASEYWPSLKSALSTGPDSSVVGKAIVQFAG